MAYIPENAEWFLGQIVEEIRVAGQRENIVHISYLLINARTPEEAYRKALKLGEQCNCSYKNEHNEQVTVRFVGLRDLDVIHGPLEHGCEIMFNEKLGVNKRNLKQLVRKKKDLEAFLPIRERPGRPNYASKEVMDEARVYFTEKRKDS